MAGGQQPRDGSQEAEGVVLRFARPVGGELSPHDTSHPATLSDVNPYPIPQAECEDFLPQVFALHEHGAASFNQVTATRPQIRPDVL